MFCCCISVKCSFAYKLSTNSHKQYIPVKKATFICVLKIKYSIIQNGCAHAQGYLKYKIQYLSYFFTDIDQICSKILGFRAWYFQTYIAFNGHFPLSLHSDPGTIHVVNFM